jgi:NADPH:quinone reductase-like Zn-dependent oxidoreductase
MKLMRSVRFSQFGNPAEVLTVEDLPKPEAGKGEVLLRLIARSINPSDLLTVSGQYLALPKLPATPGNECVGVIEALGEGVTGLRVGQRVVPLGANQGTWQEYVTVRAERVLPVPDGIADGQAATLLVNPPTAWIMLNDVLHVQPGEWVLQTAAGSAVGAWVIKIARQMGAKTINVVRRRDQVEILKALGADEVICSADEDVLERVKTITKGKGASYALDAVGGATGSEALNALARNGKLLVYGLLSGEPIPVDGRIIGRETIVQGFWLTSWLRNATPAQTATVFGALLPMLSSKEAESPIEATYDLSDIITAVSHAMRPGRNGKILLTG